jgi:hypothetical protein
MPATAFDRGMEHRINRFHPIVGVTVGWHDDDVSGATSCGV